MKLKKAESEMLPVWVLSGVYTKPFFAWLNEAEKSNIWEHQNDTVVKMRQDRKSTRLNSSHRL